MSGSAKLPSGTSSPVRVTSAEGTLKLSDDAPNKRQDSRPSGLVD